MPPKKKTYPALPALVSEVVERPPPSDNNLKTPERVWRELAKRADNALTMGYSGEDFEAMCLSLNNAATKPGQEWAAAFGHRVTRYLARKAWSRALARVKREAQARDPEVEKQVQIRRVTQAIAKLHAKGDIAAAAKYEVILADILGTREPDKVHVTATVNASLVSVAMSLTEERRKQLVDEARRRRELAARFVEERPKLAAVVGGAHKGVG